MKLMTSIIVGALVLGTAGAALANSNAAVQKGRLSLEGYVYTHSHIGLTAEVGVTNNIALQFGNADIIPTAQLKLQLPEKDSKMDVSLTGGVILWDNSGFVLGADCHYKVNNSTRLFADISMNSVGHWDFINLGFGAAYNLSKEVALIGSARSVDGDTHLGLGVRFTL